MSYLVVLRGTGTFAGITTVNEFGDKETFEAAFAADGSVMDGAKYVGGDEVILEGCTADEGNKIARCTLVRHYVRAAIRRATDPEGRVNQEIARMHTINAAIMFGSGHLKYI